MAGRGPAPKDSSLRKRNASGVTMVEVTPSPQPSLQDAIGQVNPLTDEPWSKGTLMLWESLRSFPTTKDLVLAQWLSLARAMMLDDALLAGNAKVAAEARLRNGKFGIDPDDVARMRYQFAIADEAEDRVKRRRGNPAPRKTGTNDPRLKLVE